MAREAVLGLHGRVAVTLVGARGSDLAVVDRRDVRTRESQPYHDAQGLPLEEAERLIAAAMDASIERATRDLADLVADLAGQGLMIGAAGVVARDYRLPKTLAATLRSHPACHAAEGRMTADALLAACNSIGLEPLAVIERSIDPAVEALGKAAGPPWRKEHKLAATAALRAAEI